MTVMKDVAIAKQGYAPSERVVTKIQDFQQNEELFRYCALPQVGAQPAFLSVSNICSVHTIYPCALSPSAS